jgi:hypothetical protein
MPSTLQNINWFPGRGLDLDSPIHQVDNQHAASGLNWYSVDGKNAEKKFGYDEVNTSAVSASPNITGLHSLYLSNGTDYELVSTSNGDIWTDSSGTITTKILSGLSTSYPLDYTQFLDTGIWADGGYYLKTWNGSASGTVSAGASAIACEVHLNKLFTADINSSTIRYSQTGSISTFTGAGTDTFNFEQNNGQNIVGMQSFARNELIIFKERSMGKLIGYDKASFNLLTIDRSIGCACKRSMQNFKANTTGGLMLWANWDGIYAYDGSTPKKVSQKIQPFWDSINKNYMKDMVSAIDEDTGLYFLSVPYGSGQTTNNYTIVLNLNQPYQDDEGFHLPAFIWSDGWYSMNQETSTNTAKVVMGGTGYKYYYSDMLYSNAGSSVTAYIVSPGFTFDTLGYSNALRRLYCVMSSATGNMSLYGNFVDSDDWVLQQTFDMSGGAARLGIDFALGISPLGFTEANFSQRINTNLRGRRIKIKFEQASDSDRFTLNAPVELYFKRGGMQG